MTAEATVAQRTMGVIIDVEKGRTFEDSASGLKLIWDCALIPIGKYTDNYSVHYVVDVITALDMNRLTNGLSISAEEGIGSKFLEWCVRNGIPQPDSKCVRKIVNAMMADSSSMRELVYADRLGEVEPGVWCFKNGVVVDGQYIAMEPGTHSTARSGRTVVYAPTYCGDEEVGPDPLDPETEGHEISEWCGKLIDMYGSHAPILCAAWMRATVMRSMIAKVDAQLPALYMCGDSHRGKTLLATITTRMLGSHGERPHASMVSATLNGVHAMATRRNALPFVLDELKPYNGIHDNDLVKAMVNGDIPAKATRNGKLRESHKIMSVPILISEFAPGEMSSIVNRIFMINLVTTGASANTDKIPSWVWWDDPHKYLYARWSNRIYSEASTMDEAEFLNLWGECREDATTICFDNGINMNRTITATAVLMLGFKLMNRDANGALTPIFLDFCNTVGVCLDSMRKMVSEVAPMNRFTSSVISAWAMLDNRYPMASRDKICYFSPTLGVVIDPDMFHGMLLDTRRLDPSRLGNATSMKMALESEGFRMIDERGLRGRYRMPAVLCARKPWAHGLARMLNVMGCTGASHFQDIVDSATDRIAERVRE